MRARLAVLLAPVAIAAGLAPGRPALAAPRLQAGLWEVSVELSDGGGGSKVPPTSQRECLSQRDVDADPVPELVKGACRATHVQRAGDKITWELDCGDAGKGKGEVTYGSPTSYDGWMTLESAGTHVRTTIKARRVGDC